MAEQKQLTFEQALEILESCAQKLDAGDVSLEESIRIYEEGVKYYKICDSILKNAKQMIEEIRKEELHA
ncbi:MAG: exodeoxyribonuclease VII small subunit [Clostridiales Family XIII bacterium]|nr:exodeoxyribonuclease VII small subunit [Clostridiales Family XIII bacterium]